MRADSYRLLQPDGQAAPAQCLCIVTVRSGPDARQGRPPYSYNEKTTEAERGARSLCLFQVDRELHIR
jgi:hypothetical protein